MLFLVFAVMLNAAGVFAKSEGTYINTDSVKSGVIYVNYTNEGNVRAKLMVEKDGSKYTYNLDANTINQGFPLQMGDGEYKVSVLENVSGNKYKYVYKEVINAKIEKGNLVYLNSVQDVNWKAAPKTTRKAKELVAGKKSAEDKVKAVYEYLVSNYSYDYEKLDKLSVDYVPEADRMLEEGKGICYDFASMFAVMLRSQGVPVKLVKGYTKNVEGYHAWNEVYDSKTGKWEVVDTTYDAAARKAKLKTAMYKKANEYEKVYEY